jgi:FG-GAP-like repeat
LVDFDGDGRLDLISGSTSNDQAAFHVFRRKKDGSWAPRQRFEVTPASKVSTLMGGSFVTAADWNGDGVPDLLIRQGVGNGILVALGPFKENGPIALTHEIDFMPKGFVMDFAVADWDRDGKPDLLVREAFLDGGGKYGIYWYKNLGGDGLPKLAEGKLLVEIASDMHVQGFCVGDWNGDGWPDLIVTQDVLTAATPDGKQDWRATVWVYLRE